MNDHTTSPTVTPDPDRDGVILHLPEITYLDTQTWAVDVGLTTEGLAALRTLLAVLPAPVDRAAVLREAAEAIALDRDSTLPGGGKGAYRRAMNRAEGLLRRMADETAATETDTEPTAEAIARDHVTTLHLIGEQLSTIEGWFWEHLADVREAKQPAAGARQDGAQPARAHCVCGDPIELRDSTNPSSWIHSPGTDTPCLSARPDAGTRRRLADPELYTPRQDGAQQQ